jgi:hypothetical protein
MLHPSGLQGVGPHGLERRSDATFMMSKRVRHLDNLRSLKLSAWDYDIGGSRDESTNGTPGEPTIE